MANTTTTAESYYFPAEPAGALRRRTSWQAIFAGAMVALAIQLVLGLLGLGIGLSTVNPAQEARPVGTGLGVGAVIWWTLVTLVASFVGGWVAGRLAGNRMRFDRMLHGLMAWALVTLVTFYLLTTAIGGLVSGATGIVTQGLVSAQQAFPGFSTQAQQAAQNVTPEQRAQIEQQARETAQKAAKGASAASLVTAVLLLLSAGAAAWGGSLAPVSAMALAAKDERLGGEPPVQP